LSKVPDFASDTISLNNLRCWHKHLSNDENRWAVFRFKLETHTRWHNKFKTRRGKVHVPYSEECAYTGAAYHSR